MPSLRWSHTYFAIGVAVFATACTSDDASNGGGGASSGGNAGGGGIAAGGVGAGGGGAGPDGPSDWRALVDGDWTMPAGEEGYVCVRKTIQEDVFVRGFGAIAPLGTHHTLLTFERDAEPRPDEVFDCNAATNGPSMLFGSGVGTEDITFPDGVAVKLSAGDQLLLNLHLYNTDTDELTGTSGIRVLTTTEAEVEHEAEQILAGKVFGLTVEPGITTQVGGCVMDHDVTIFAAAPHMHQLGSYLKAVAEPVDGPERVLIDAPYSFEEQIYYPVDPPLELRAGDRVRVDCEYTNEGTETVTFGDSSDSEMCFSGLYRYPKGDGSSFICTEGGEVSAAGFDAPPCASEGDQGNSVGVGRYCTAGGNVCGELFCLADVFPVDFANFCTKACQDDAECGEGASCASSAAGSGCIPDACALPSVDGGASSG